MRSRSVARECGSETVAEEGEVEVRCVGGQIWQHTGPSG